MIFTTCLDYVSVSECVCVCKPLLSCQELSVSVPRLFKVYQEALTQRQERANEKRMKGPQHFINHWMCFSFSLTRFPFSLRLHTSSLFTHLPKSHSFFHPALTLSLRCSTFLLPFLSSHSASTLFFFSSSLLAGVDLAMLH